MDRVPNGTQQGTLGAAPGLCTSCIHMQEPSRAALSSSKQGPLVLPSTFKLSWAVAWAQENSVGDAPQGPARSWS